MLNSLCLFSLPYCLLAGHLLYGLLRAAALHPSGGNEPRQKRR
jgi:hypothetical protein